MDFEIEIHLFMNTQFKWKRLKCSLENIYPGCKIIPHMVKFNLKYKKKKRRREFYFFIVILFRNVPYYMWNCPKYKGLKQGYPITNKKFDFFY